MLSLAASLIGAGKWLREAAGAAFRWVLAHPWQAGLIAALALAGWQWRGKNEALSDLTAMTELRDAEIASHKATKASYRHAQAEAAELDRQNVERVKREHAAAIKQMETTYANDLSRARGDFALRLRTATTRSCVASSGDGTAMSAIPVLSTGTMQAGGDAIVSRDDAELGIVNSLRLKSLIAAWKDIEGINVNAPGTD